MKRVSVELGSTVSCLCYKSLWTMENVVDLLNGRVCMYILKFYVRQLLPKTCYYTETVYCRLRVEMDWNLKKSAWFFLKFWNCVRWKKIAKNEIWFAFAPYEQSLSWLLQEGERRHFSRVISRAAVQISGLVTPDQDVFKPVFTGHALVLLVNRREKRLSRC